MVAVESELIGFQQNKQENIYYSIDINPNKSSLALKEHINGLRKDSITVIARNYGWRAEKIRILCLALKNRSDIGVSIKSTKDNLLYFDPIVASRVFIAQKTVSSLKNNDGQTNNILETILNLSDSETAYWAWKMAASKDKAILAFKILNSGDF